MNRLQKFAIVGATLVAGTVWATPRFVDRSYNPVSRPAVPHVVSDRAKDLFKQLRIADLHADSLLWPRNVLNENRTGQVDVPRLMRGRVALQVFGAPTQFPFGRSFQGNPKSGYDSITPLVVTSGWHPQTWTSRLARAVHMGDVLKSAASASNGRVSFVGNKRDLERYLAEWQRDPNRIGAFMGLEGLHALDGRPEAIDDLFAAGYRVIGLAHFIDNDFSGSSTGVEKHGLTDAGRRILARMEQIGLIIDLAHASPATIRDVTAIARRPMLVSHTGVQGTCPGPRNLADDDIRLIAAKGGLIGLGVWAHAVCDISPKATARAMRHVRDLVGIRHVALGTDFDGGVRTSFDAGELSVLVEALLQEGFSDDDIRLALGENTIAFFKANLPD